MTVLELSVVPLYTCTTRVFGGIHVYVCTYRTYICVYVLSLLAYFADLILTVGLVHASAYVTHTENL